MPNRYTMIETVYLHLSFKTKSGEWSINLPFVCDQCGVCCKIDDFLTAGPAKVNPQENPQLHLKVKEIYEEMGERWEANEAKYDHYITHTPCPFLKDKICSIYPYRPDGCRQFPNTPFGILSEDCAALDRFKKQQTALCRGRASKKTLHFTTEEAIKKNKHSEKQYQDCINKLKKAEITEEELALFRTLNGNV
ncbi:MAG TPA: YkgJ family cysteine cluster protein [Candidatus Acidoferrales bacterium]|nr:YkgJ family cysteine cluster protein [Candidatus Acidoferrales bacterium]